MMTSFAFIAGLVPLVIATGAGAATVRAVGTAIFGGMLAASFLGIFVIPGLYVLLETIREKCQVAGWRPATNRPAAFRRENRCGMSRTRDRTAQARAYTTLLRAARLQNDQLVYRSNI